MRLRPLKHNCTTTMRQHTAGFPNHPLTDHASNKQNCVLVHVTTTWDKLAYDEHDSTHTPGRTISGGGLPLYLASTSGCSSYGLLHTCAGRQAGNKGGQCPGPEELALVLSS